MRPDQRLAEFRGPRGVPEGVSAKKAGEGSPLRTSRTSRQIGLSGDLTRSLEYLTDTEMRKLKDAVNRQIERRSQMAPRESVRIADQGAVQIPNAKCTHRGVVLKPAAVAWTRKDTPSLVRCVLQFGRHPAKRSLPTGIVFVKAL